MLDVEKLMSDARSEAGLSDFGSDEFLEPLQRLVEALNNEAKLNDFGAFRAELSLVKGLSYRLRIEDYLSRHSDVLEQKVERPIFIVGLPRTGTTALHHMLNQDPANHTLRIWEGQNPVPPPEEASYTTDPRIAETEENLALTESFLPGFLKTHLLAAQEPDECYMLFNRAFMSVEYSALYHIPSYANWLYQQNLNGLYAYHKRELQLLQSRKPGRWVLKAPFHQLGLEAILNTYPDAIIVQTHRAPMSFVASGCSFNELLRKSGSDDIDPHVIGQDWMEMLTVYTQTFEAARARLEPLHPGQFVDVHHDSFVADPFPVIENIYQCAGDTLTTERRGLMQSWLNSNPKGKHGKHTYNLEKYGISRADVETLFADYMARYGLRME